MVELSFNMTPAILLSQCLAYHDPKRLPLHAIPPPHGNQGRRLFLLSFLDYVQDCITRWRHGQNDENTKETVAPSSHDRQLSTTTTAVITPSFGRMVEDWLSFLGGANSTITSSGPEIGKPSSRATQTSSPSANTSTTTTYAQMLAGVLVCPLDGNDDSDNNKGWEMSATTISHVQGSSQCASSVTLPLVAAENLENGPCVDGTSDESRETPPTKPSCRPADVLNGVVLASSKGRSQGNS